MKKKILIFAIVSAFIVLLTGCISTDGEPANNSTYSPAQLKYLLLDHYGENRFFYCDPDYYPVGRGDELERALATFPSIENDSATFNALIARKALQAPFSNDDELLIYREWKKLNAIPLEPADSNAYSYVLRLGTEQEQDGRSVSGIILTNGAITEQHSQQAFLTCPICLSGNTLINTPAGQMRVGELRAGMMVDTLDSKGVKIAVPILQVSKTRVPASHRVVRLLLSDGRKVFVSPMHPTADGRLIGSLAVGDELDGSTVASTALVPYEEEFTYDLLPAGTTGTYWADGILLGSTL